MREALSKYFLVADMPLPLCGRYECMIDITE